MGAGFGTLGLARSPEDEGCRRALSRRRSARSAAAALHAAKAKRVIFLFTEWRACRSRRCSIPSQTSRNAGQQPEELTKNYQRSVGKLFPSPFKFGKYGENGDRRQRAQPARRRRDRRACACSARCTPTSPTRAGAPDLSRTPGELAADPPQSRFLKAFTYGLGTEKPESPR